LISDRRSPDFLNSKLFHSQISDFRLFQISDLSSQISELRNQPALLKSLIQIADSNRSSQIADLKSEI